MLFIIARHVLRKSKPFFTVCESTRYGPTCSLECADSCVNSTCNNYTGSCMYGCQEGFYGDQCDRDWSYSCPTGCDRITGECIEIVLSAGLENFVTNHAVKIVKTDVTKTLAAARGGVYLVALEIFVMKRATIDVYLVMNQELTTVSIDFIFF